jgi:zinc transporter, ZIP family
VYYERWMPVRRPVQPQPVEPGPGGPGSGGSGSGEPAPVTPVAGRRPGAVATALATPAGRLALFIAIGIGLHNFAEGLAIGQSAASGQVNLAVLLVVGFSLHNATEGFGVVGPLAGAAQRPSWSLLGLLGLIGGGPTFLGTVVGRSFVNTTVYLGFLALAAGSVLYVILQLLRSPLKLGPTPALYWGLLAGLLLGYATDFVVTAAGV